MPKANEQVGDYTLVRRIGRGSFGQVWLAEDRTVLVTTQVAIKFIEDYEDTQFELVEREAKVWLEASGHPNILPIMKAKKYDDQVVFISEYAKEGSLKNWLKANNSKAPDEQSAIKMMLGILTGLEYLHNKKILHRDLKPANILLQNAIPKLADFGLSKIRASINKSSQNTLGTPAYMSPEAFQTKGAEQADVWAAGIIFYEMLAGRLPFEGDNAWAIMFAITTNKPKELPKEVSREIQEIIYKALEKDLTKRYQTPKEMLLELEKVEKILATKSLLKAYTFETITLDSYAKVIERKTGKAQYYEEDLGEGVKLEMVEIPAGTFLMGTSEQDKEKVIAEYAKCWNEEDGCKYVGWEMPQHQVTVSSFYIGKYEITQEQWEKVMGKNPSYFKGKKLPVEQVSWNKAVEFCKKLSAKTGHYYRLPSEAEWEYAARGATTTAFAFGETITPSIVNYDGNYPYADAPKGEYRAKTIEVGSLGVANAFGLYDMHGNVWEWCQDPWHSDYKEAPTDGSIWEVGNDTSDRVVRGGSWCNYSSDCRAALRYWLAPGDNDADSSIGLRVVLVARTLH